MRLKLGLLACLLCVAATEPPIHENHHGLAHLRWQLAAETSLMAGSSAASAVATLHHLTVHHLQVTPGALDTTPAKLLAALKKDHMDVVSVGPVSALDPAALQSAMTLTHQLHAKWLLVEGSEPTAQSLERLAAKANVRLALLITDGKVPDGPHLGLAVDLAACVRAGHEPMAVLKAAGKRLCLVVIDDINTAGQPVAFGDGRVNAAGVVATLKEMKFKGILAVGAQGVAAGNRLGRFIDSVNTLSTLIGPVPARHAR